MAKFEIQQVWPVLRENFSARPIWLNVLLLFCAYMTFIYLPWDIFIKPVAEDREVWFGFTFAGWWAKGTALLHWLVYGAGTYGLWHMHKWMWPWAFIYVLQVAFSMAAWPFFAGRETTLIGVIPASLFLLLAFFLWRARPQFLGPDTIEAEQVEE